MKALHFSEHGGIEKLRYGEVRDPKPAEGEVLIKVRACALNRLDLWVLQGWAGLKLEMPHIGGADIAGEIVEVHRNVFGWRAGDHVVVNPGISTAEDEFTLRGEDSLSPHYQILGEGRRGGFAELVTVPATNLISKPAEIDFPTAAAPLLVGVTAWRMLKHRAQLAPNETVLIVGAGGGLNSFCIQVVTLMGGKAIALTSSEEKAKRARELGASETIDYLRYPDWSRKVREITGGQGVNVVVDNVGAKTFEQSLRSLSRGGRLVTVGNTSGPVVSFDNRLVFAKQLSILGSTMGSAQDFREVTQAVWDGKLRAVVDSVIPLANGAEGYRRLERGEQFGKIVLQP